MFATTDVSRGTAELERIFQQLDPSRMYLAIQGAAPSEEADDLLKLTAKLSQKKNAF